LTVENPEIVNGLQTSTEVHGYFRNSNTEKESRNVLVRVIVPNAAGSRDRIIKATNSQTAIPPASLRATDPIHRNIEQYLRPFNLFYDRRKNFYKNEGKPINRIISIPQMAQAVMAIVLRRPDTARARPSSLIKRDEEYLRLFSSDYPIEVYRASAELLKQTEHFLSEHPDAPPSAERNNLKFYAAMAVSQVSLQSRAPSPNEIASLAGTPASPDQLEAAYQIVKAEYQRLGGTDQVAKGPDLLASAAERLRMTYATTP
jgi:hypothetical protein